MEAQHFFITSLILYTGAFLFSKAKAELGVLAFVALSASLVCQAIYLEANSPVREWTVSYLFIKVAFAIAFGHFFWYLMACLFPTYRLQSAVLTVSPWLWFVWLVTAIVGVPDNIPTKIWMFLVVLMTARVTYLMLLRLNRNG